MGMLMRTSRLNLSLMYLVMLWAIAIASAFFPGAIEMVRTKVIMALLPFRRPHLGPRDGQKLHSSGDGGVIPLTRPRRAPEGVPPAPSASARETLDASVARLSGLNTDQLPRAPPRRASGKATDRRPRPDGGRDTGRSHEAHQRPPSPRRAGSSHLVGPINSDGVAALA